MGLEEADDQYADDGRFVDDLTLCRASCSHFFYFIQRPGVYSQWEWKKKAAPTSCRPCCGNQLHRNCSPWRKAAENCTCQSLLSAHRGPPKGVFFRFRRLIALKIPSHLRSDTPCFARVLISLPKWLFQQSIWYYNCLIIIPHGNSKNAVVVKKCRRPRFYSSIRSYRILPGHPYCWS